MFLCISLSTGAVHLPRRGSHNQNNTTWPVKANQIDAKKMHVSAASLAPDSSVHKATPSDNSERTARSGTVVETIFLSRPWRVQCRHRLIWIMKTDLYGFLRGGVDSLVQISKSPYSTFPIAYFPSSHNYSKIGCFSWSHIPNFREAPYTSRVPFFMLIFHIPKFTWGSYSMFHITP